MARADERDHPDDLEPALVRATLLSDASALFAAALPRPPALAQLAELIVPRVAEGCMIESAGAMVTAWWHRRKRVRSNKPGRAQPRIVAPVRARDQTLGAITLYGKRLTAADRELAEELGRRLGQALDHARLYRELEDALKTRNEVMRMVSHDLQNSIGAIRLNAYALLRTLPADDQARDHAESIQQTAAVTSRLVRDLADLADIEARQLSLRRRPEDVGAIVDDTVAAIRPAAMAKQIHLEAVHTGVHLVSCDRDRITQVLSNLIVNAINFTPPHGRVTIEVEPGPVDVTIGVRDTGPGVAREHRLLVFEKHWRAKGVTLPGAGLGLFIARSIVEAHDGRIWVDRRVGSGAAFRFTLPKARNISTRGGRRTNQVFDRLKSRG